MVARAHTSQASFQSRPRIRMAKLICSRRLHSGNSAITEQSQSQSGMEVEDDASNYMSNDGDMIGSPGSNMHQDPLEPFSQTQYGITNDYSYPGGWAGDSQPDYQFFSTPGIP
jgi:hypothetical protein